MLQHTPRETLPMLFKKSTLYYIAFISPANNDQFFLLSLLALGSHKIIFFCGLATKALPLFPSSLVAGKRKKTSFEARKKKSGKN